MALFGRKSPTPAAAAPAPVVEEAQPRRTLDEQRAAMVDAVTPLRPFGMQLDGVTGLTLCEDIVSDLDLPMLTTALIDGYGVRASDTVGADHASPADLDVHGVGKGRDGVPGDALPEGGCVQVAAGAPVPRGVDAVLPLADADRAGDIVSIRREVRPQEGLSLRGSALAEGQLLLTADSVLDPLAIGVLAEVGLDKVLVRPRPRLVVFAVGADLVAPGMPITAVGQSYAAATLLLAAECRELGATVYPLDAVRPDALAVRQALHDHSIRADLMIVLASTDADAHLVGEVLAELGPVDRAWVLLDGGRGIATGRLGDERTPVVVLPGSPVGAYVAHQLLVRPLIDRLSARDTAPLVRVRARAASALPGGEGVHYVPVRLEGEHAAPLRGAAGFAYDLFRADALAEVPAAGVVAGGEVDCLPISPAVAG